MYALRKDTLAGLKQSSLFEPRRIDVPLVMTIAKLNAYMQSPTIVRPEAEAVKFYFANHIYSLIASKYGPHEPLPEAVYPLARGYIKMSSELIVRLVYYTLMITTREARHFPGPTTVLDNIEIECGKGVGTFFKGGDSAEETLLKRLQEKPPHCSLERYMRALVKIFNESPNWSSSYGGPNWGNIAETLRKMVAGDLSAEMFADVAFTLAHNGGPMFNKGMLYDFDQRYPLLKILDVQRSGQIPQMVTNGELPVQAQKLDAYALSYVKNAIDVFPAEVLGYVDWYKVETLGALQSYGKEKQAQLIKHGPSLHASEKEKKIARDVAKAAAVAAEAEAKAKEQAALEASKFYVGPGANDFAVIVERKAA